MAYANLSLRGTALRRTPRVSFIRLLDVWRSRRALAALDADALSDIGIDAKTAQSEANRPIWDVPNNWKD